MFRNKTLFDGASLISSSIHTYTVTIFVAAVASLVSRWESTSGAISALLSWSGGGWRRGQQAACMHAGDVRSCCYGCDCHIFQM